MRKGLLFCALLVVMASNAVALDRYSFHIRVTDGRTGLLANPGFAELKVTPERLAEAAKERVIVLERSTGTKWRYYMLTWEKNPNDELRLNESGGARPQHPADISLMAAPAGMVKIRCLTRGCAISATNPGRAATELHLKADQWGEVPLDSDLSIVLEQTGTSGQTH
jgi:hypothetical protein